MSEPTIAPAFPEPYLQPLGSRDCGFHAVTYLARCLGHPDVTADDVKAWRESSGYHEDQYLARVLGCEHRRWGQDRDDDAARRRWWLGVGGADWIREWLDDGWLGLAVVHRIPTLGHSVAVLDASDEGVLIMDPWPGLGGHVIEPWNWFLGSGPGNHGCHRIDGWYRVPEEGRR